MKKRVLLIFIGLFSIRFSITMFPSFEEVTPGIILQKLIFQPFSWLAAVVLFIIGFLSLAQIITDVLTQTKKTTGEWLSLATLLAIYIYISTMNMFAALLAISFSLYYGIMDADTKSVDLTANKSEEP